MIITNKRKLPEAIVRVIKETLNEPHNRPGEYSITTLQNGVLETQLTNRHFEEIEVDASKEIWAIFGTAIHSLLEKKARIEDGYLVERAVRYQFPAHYQGYNITAGAITGRCDLINFNGEVSIEDYKTTKAAALLFKDTIEKWKKQLKGYCAILNLSEHIEVHKCRIYALLKDWSEGEAKKNPNYPDAPCVPLDFNFSTEEIEQEWTNLVDAYIKNKIGELTDSEDIPECTKEQRWAKDDSWAIVKAGASKASKIVRTSKQDAFEILKKEYGPAYGIEERLGEDTKCLYFCKAKEFCKYYNKKYCFKMKEETKE